MFEYKIVNRMGETEYAGVTMTLEGAMDICDFFIDAVIEHVQTTYRQSFLHHGHISIKRGCGEWTKDF